MRFVAVSVWLVVVACQAQAPEERTASKVSKSLRIKSVAKLTAQDVGDRYFGEGCRGGDVNQPGGLDGLPWKLAGGVAVVQWGGAKHVLVPGNGLTTVCVIRLDAAGAVSKTWTLPAPAPPVLGFSVFADKTRERVLGLGLGGVFLLDWENGEVALTPQPVPPVKGRIWPSAWTDLRPQGIEVALLAISSLLPPDNAICYDVWGKPGSCDVDALPEGATAMTSKVATSLKVNQLLWPGMPAMVRPSAFAFGTSTGVFLTDLVGADHLYRLEASRQISNVAWAQGVAGGQVITTYPSLGADVIDLDGDTWQDLLVATARDGIRWIRSHKGSGFEDGTVAKGLFAATAGKSWYGVLGHDVDGDGDVDVIATGEPGTFVFVQDSAGRFGGGVPFSTAPARGAALGDLTGDGWPELIVARRGGGGLVLALPQVNAPWKRVMKVRRRGGFADAALVSIRGEAGVSRATELRRDRGWMSASEPAAWWAEPQAMDESKHRLQVRFPANPDKSYAWPTADGAGVSIVEPEGL